MTRQTKTEVHTESDFKQTLTQLNFLIILFKEFKHSDVSFMMDMMNFNNLLSFIYKRSMCKYSITFFFMNNEFKKFCGTNKKTNFRKIKKVN